MASNLQEVEQLLQASLDPKQQKNAESALRQKDDQPGLSLMLLQIVASNQYPNTSRLASALYFKNFVKRNWIDEDGNHRLPADEVTAIKRELVALMLAVPPSMQAQLGDAISVIADSDFWERWDTLIDDLVSRLTPDNPVVNNGVLQVAHSIFKRWRPLFKSDELYTEILHVLKTFAGPFLTLLQNTDNAIQQNENNGAFLKQQFTTLHLCMRILYDLSCQDLPEAFEDHKEGIKNLLNKYLPYDNRSLHTDDESEPDILDLTKASIFEVLTLFAQKEEEVFGPYFSEFIGSSWNLLTNVSTDTKHDVMVSKGLTFLTSVTANRGHAESFNNEAVLKQVVEGVILPNLTLRESDVELFEDEPIEFTRRDLEGADSETRRRAATEFLRQLMQQFQPLVTKVVSGYIDAYLQDYSQDKTEKWKSKDTAVYLFTSVAAVGTITAGQGVKSTNPEVDIIDFFSKNIALDLTSNDSHVILQVDAIKYLYTFRSQLTAQQWQDAFPLLVRHLGSTNYVVHTYAAIAVERTLILTNEQTGQPLVPHSTITPLAKDLLQRLFLLVQMDPAPEKVQENEFLMRCVMRVLIVIKDTVLPIVDFVITNFVNILRVIRHNPSNPRFYYFLFEAIGALIRFAAPSEPNKLENGLYQPFAEILTNDVQEFTPYIFQLFAALLEANPSGTLTQVYQDLIGPCITPALWESKGNVPALTRLLTSLISRGASFIVEKGQLEPILGIFQKLVSAKSSEVYAFDLLETLIQRIPIATLQPYFTPIFSLILTRLSKSPTQMFTIRFVRLYHLMSARDGADEGLGADAFVAITDTVQNDIFRQLYTSIILPETAKLIRPLDRKIAVVSLTKTLADSTAFVDKYPKGWAFSCEALLKLMLDPPVPQSNSNGAFAGDEGALAEQDIDDPSFGVGFTQLSTCRRAPKDPFPDVGTDLKGWIGRYLREADQRHQGRIGRFVQERLSEQTRQALGTYLQG